MEAQSCESEKHYAWKHMADMSSTLGVASLCYIHLTSWSRDWISTVRSIRICRCTGPDQHRQGSSDFRAWMDSHPKTLSRMFLFPSFYLPSSLRLPSIATESLKNHKSDLYSLLHSIQH
jgi:hypothetical protein